MPGLQTSSLEDSVGGGEAELLLQVQELSGARRFADWLIRALQNITSQNPCAQGAKEVNMTARQLRLNNGYKNGLCVGDFHILPTPLPSRWPHYNCYTFRLPRIPCDFSPALYQNLFLILTFCGPDKERSASVSSVSHSPVIHGCWFH